MSKKIAVANAKTHKHADDVLYDDTEKFSTALAKKCGAKRLDDDFIYYWPALKTGKFAGYRPRITFSSTNLLLNGLGIRFNADDGHGNEASQSYETRKTLDGTLRLLDALAKRAEFPQDVVVKMHQFVGLLYEALLRRVNKAVIANTESATYREIIATILGTASEHVMPDTDEDDQFFSEGNRVLMKFHFWASKQRLDAVSKFLEKHGVFSSYYSSGGSSRRMTLIVKEGTVIEVPKPTKTQLATKRKAERQLELNDISSRLSSAGDLVKEDKLEEATKLISDQIIRMAELFSKKRKTK